MKKKFCLLLVTALLAAAAPAQIRDRIRISYVGFNCNNETADNAFEMDGKGDEVFIYCNWVMAEKNGNKAFNGQYKSRIHGDINGHYGWIQAGTRSAKGGIRTSDQFRGNTVIGEFDFDDGQILNFTPTIWEYDGDPSMYNSFTNYMNNAGNVIKDNSIGFSKRLPLTASNSSQVTMNFKSQNLTVFSTIVGDIFGQAKDRPVGMDANGGFSPKSLVLTRDIVHKFSQINNGYGLGVYEVSYDENLLGNTRCHGAYSVLIMIEVLNSTNIGTGAAGAGGTPATTNGTKQPVPPPVKLPVKPLPPIRNGH